MDTAAVLTVYRFTHLTLERNLEGLSRRLLGKAGAIA